MIRNLRLDPGHNAWAQEKLQLGLLRTSKMLARLKLETFNFISCSFYFLQWRYGYSQTFLFHSSELFNDWYVPVSELVKEVRWCHRNSRSVSNPPKHMKYCADNDWWMELLVNKSMMDVTWEQVPPQDTRGEVLKIVTVMLIK